MDEPSGLRAAAALRRDTRRKKILENSTSRLKLIEGVLSSNDKCSSSFGNDSVGPSTVEIKNSGNAFCKKFDDVTEMNAKFTDIIKNDEDLKKISDFLLQKEKIDEPKNCDEFLGFRTLTEEQTENSWLVTIQRKKLHYILLAIFVNISLNLNLGYLFYDNIFCPFYTLKIIETFMASRKEPDNLQAFPTLLLACLPKGLQKSAKIALSILPSLFSDLFLYIFAFITGSKLINLQT